MSRRILYLAAATFSLSGCVFVNQPLSDPEKAEADKQLFGKWELEAASIDLFRQRGEADKKHLCEIENPIVKGNPKGLMHYRDAEKDFWFFITTIGKHTYWTVYLDGKDGFADLSQEGAFEKWKKRDLRLYAIVLAVLEGDRLTIHLGGTEKVKGVMEAELIPPGKIGEDDTWKYFKTPPGWLAK